MACPGRDSAAALFKAPTFAAGDSVWCVVSDIRSDRLLRSMGTVFLADLAETFQSAHAAVGATRSHEMLVSLSESLLTPRQVSRINIVIERE